MVMHEMQKAKAAVRFSHFSGEHRPAAWGENGQRLWGAPQEERGLTCLGPEARHARRRFLGTG